MLLLSGRSKVTNEKEQDYDPEDMLKLVDHLESKGYNSGQVRRYLQNQNDLLDHVKQEFVGQDIRWAVRNNAGVHSAIKSMYVQKQRAAFHKADSLKPSSLKEGWPGPERMKRWYDEAKVFADRLWNQFMNRP